MSQKTRNNLTHCFSCGANCPNLEGETHEYMLSSPGCWKMYGEVLAWEYEDIRYFRAHQYTVDAYACQHPGKPERRSINSVGIHLCSLYVMIERQAEPHEVIRFRQELSKQNNRQGFFYWLEPPENLGEFTIEYLWKADSPLDHFNRSVQWAKSVWHAWGSYHPVIHSWVDNV